MHKLTSNPIHVYKLVKRLTQKFPFLLTEIDKLELDKDIILKAKKLENDEYFPSIDDFYGSAISLLRIQYTYNLNPIDIANGKLREIQSAARLSPYEVFELGKMRNDTSVHVRINKFNGIEYALAIDWTQAALKY